MRTSRWDSLLKIKTRNLQTNVGNFLQVETIFQRIPQGANHINRQPLNNTNGIHNNVHPRFINLINNNASSNNNNINQQSSNHIVAEPQLQQSQSSDSTMLRNVSSGQRYGAINNDNMQRRSDNYQTTSEGSTESSSESSAEEWESGEFECSSFAFNSCAHFSACISSLSPPFTLT